MPEQLTEKQQEQALQYLHQAANVARDALCEARACGTVIVSEDGVTIAEAFNQPPAALKSQQRCGRKHELKPGFKSDKTCCVHAEQRAIMKALAMYPDKLQGSTLYFASVDKEGNYLQSGPPYCTICSKMALEAGVKYWVLDHMDGGVTKYDSEEYNLISFDHGDV